MNVLTRKLASIPTWALSLGIVFAGGVLLGGLLLITAWIRAANYSGFGDSGVHNLLVVGFPVTGWSLAALLALIATRIIVGRMRSLASAH